MSLKLEKFKQKIKNKKITVLGIGVSNLPLIEFLAKNGAIVTACDKRKKDDLTNEIERLSPYNISYNLGDNYLDNIDADIIFKTPGMRFDIPELAEARKRGSVVTSEMEVFFEVCDAKKIAVTGSDGKTTTTTLIAKMLEKQGYTVWLGGNIGNPLIGELENIKENDFVVLELSSFQLHTMKQSPDIAVVTNLSPNHLDMHKDMDEYVDAKKNIFMHQKANDKLVLNFDNDITHSFENEAVSDVVFFSRKAEGENCVYLKDGVVYHGCDEIMRADEIKIPGVHNIENYMAAIAALTDIVSVDTIRHIARSFGGVEHRIELVRELDGVRYYNDSIASSPTRTTAGLRSFDKKVILIAGGYDKHIPFDDFGPVLEKHVKKLFLIGVTAPKIKKAANDAGLFDVVMCDSLEEAVKLSYKAATNGDIVLLSPACASFDMFKNFAVRGNLFKELVNNL
ncbi:MAG: UDP-N-acetylmuramoyl-L-alanine--D-glutamate ligase [Ruminococcaceae bacterium]|nr:UDP-N-acetylmuramoyl-L-alanine--D-glutamate ligase [Oscillospiraceae bacterium]